MKIVFIGCIDFSYHLLQHLLQLECAHVVGVVTRRSSPLNADFHSLAPLAAEKHIPCFFADEHDQVEMAAWLQMLQPDVVYCFGWSSLLHAPVLKIPRLGVVGYHPAALPKNRGRHPLIWALALGLQETASTFFFIDEQVDAGDILSQKKISIGENDDAMSLYQKCEAAARAQLSEFTAQLASNDFPRVPQDHTCANYWRKRSKTDGCIDWRMPAQGIYNLVRALAQPYPGAHCLFQGREYKIWKLERLQDDVTLHNIEPGKVLAVEQESIVVKCGDGAVKFPQAELRTFLKAGDDLI